MDWVTAKECIGISGMPTDVHKIRAKLDRLCGESDMKRKRQGSKAFEYHTSILPAPVQAALLKKNGNIKVGDKLFSLPKPKAQRYGKEVIWARWDKASLSAQQKAQEKLDAVMTIHAMLANGVSKMEAFCHAASQYQQSARTLMRWYKAVQPYEQDDWGPALLPKHQDGQVTGSQKRKAPMTEGAWESFKADYLREEKPTLSACLHRLKRIAKEKGWLVPSESALRRRLIEEIPIEARVLFREGEHALHQMFPPQERTVLDLEAMQWITGDGYQHNVFVRWFNGEVLRPKTWYWMDVYSRKIVGWRTDVSENTDSIRLSLMDVCRNYGIPRELTIDNTRAAANKWMTGGVPNRYRFKVKEDDPKGIIPLLGIELHWTSVILGKGHGQAKPIERAFGVGGLEELVDKHPALAGAYTGPNPMEKPDNYGDRVVDAETFLAALEEGMEMYNSRPNRETEVCRGMMSFDDAFAVSYQHAVIRKATEPQLRLLMLQAEAVRVSQHGTITLESGGSIASRKNRYASTALYRYVGKKVVARFDPASLHESVAVYTLDGVLIGPAECLDKVGFGDTQAAREHKRRRTQFVKSNKLAAQAQREMTALEVAALMPGATDPQPPESRVVEMVRPVSLGNTALKAEAESEHEESIDFEQRYSESIALMREQAAKNRL